MKRTGTNLKLAIDHDLARDRSDLAASFMQVLVMSEGERWVAAQAEAVGRELRVAVDRSGQGRRISVLATASSHSDAEDIDEDGTDVGDGSEGEYEDDAARRRALSSSSAHPTSHPASRIRTASIATLPSAPSHHRTRTMSSLSGGRGSGSRRVSSGSASTSPTSLSTSPTHVRTRTLSSATTRSSTTNATSHMHQDAPVAAGHPVAPAAGHPVVTARAAVRRFATRELGRAELIASLEDYIGNATVDLLLLGAWGLAREVVGGEGIPTSYFARDDRTYRVFCERLDELGIGGEEGVGEGEDDAEAKGTATPVKAPKPPPLPRPTPTNPNRAAHKLPRKLRWQLRVLRAAVGGRKTTYRTKVELLEAELDGK
ncbi:hypothetical protein EV715DRAFT_286168 [Schizophyllum commune]